MQESASGNDSNNSLLQRDTNSHTQKLGQRQITESAINKSLLTSVTHQQRVLGVRVNWVTVVTGLESISDTIYCSTLPRRPGTLDSIYTDRQTLPRKFASLEKRSQMRVVWFIVIHNTMRSFIIIHACSLPVTYTSCYIINHTQPHAWCS